MSQASDSTGREALVQVRGLVNRFGEQVVHDGLDLDLYRGEILGVVGGSGTGKSVLLRSLVGLLQPAAGTVHFLGEDLYALYEMDRARLICRSGVLFQKGALFSSLTVLENIAVPLVEHAGLSRSQAESLAWVKLALVGLAPEAGLRYPAELSGGMVKRAALARALALDPPLLFLDEPSSGLDPIGAAAFDRLLLTLRDAFGFSVFLVTHDLDTLHVVCDRVAVLADKRVRVTGTLEEVAATPDSWVQDYFHGPRGRAAQQATQTTREVR